MLIILKNKNRLHYKDFNFKCTIGKNGTSSNKTEGDKKTPIGIFGLDKLYYRKDIIKKPITQLKCIPIKKSMGWSHDLRNKKKYNKLIQINKNIKHEKLYRLDTKYNLIIPIKYNFMKPKIGKGSAIFLHITKDFKSTAGCVAMNEKDLLILLKLINKKTKIKIT